MTLTRNAKESDRFTVCKYDATIRMRAHCIDVSACLVATVGPYNEACKMYRIECIENV